METQASAILPPPLPVLQARPAGRTSEPLLLTSRRASANGFNRPRGARGNAAAASAAGPAPPPPRSRASPRRIRFRAAPHACALRLHRPAEVTAAEAGGRVRPAEGALSRWFRVPRSPASGAEGVSVGEEAEAGAERPPGVRWPPGPEAASPGRAGPARWSGPESRAGHGLAVASAAPGTARVWGERSGREGVNQPRRRALAPGHKRSGRAPGAGRLRVQLPRPGKPTRVPARPPARSGTARG